MSTCTCTHIRADHRNAFIGRAMECAAPTCACRLFTPVLDARIAEDAAKHQVGDIIIYCGKRSDRQRGVKGLGVEQRGRIVKVHAPTVVEVDLGGRDFEWATSESGSLINVSAAQRLSVALEQKVERL